MNTKTPEPSRKARIDALLLRLPGVSAGKINGFDAYFVSDKMFACISAGGVGLRLPAATATELQFSRDNVVPFQPGGMTTSKEWIQIDRPDAADYEKDSQLFLASRDYVKGARPVGAPAPGSQTGSSARRQEPECRKGGRTGRR